MKDDNRTQATSAYWSGYKHESGCDIKRDPSFFDLGISPSKKSLISDAIAGIRLFPGAVAPHKKNRPVNMRAETGLKISRGGEKKESSRHHGHIDPSIDCPKIADSEYFPLRICWLLFLGAASAFFKEFAKFCFAGVHIK